MTLVKHELRRGRLALILWAGVVSFMLGVSILFYPEMSSQMDELTDMMANMGAFSQAFGMDRLNFGKFTDYFCVECGNVLGLGGAFFAALQGVSALAGEEKNHTADFLLAHPVSRTRIAAEKLLAVVLQVMLLNLAAAAVASLCTLVIGLPPEKAPDAGVLALVFLAYFLMQLEVAAVTFCISAFLRRGGLGIGLGLAAVFYFLNLLSNLTEDAKVLRYFTPFGYTGGADILANRTLDGGPLAAGMALGALCLVLAFWQYRRKDIA